MAVARLSDPHAPLSRFGETGWRRSQKAVRLARNACFWAARASTGRERTNNYEGSADEEQGILCRPRRGAVCLPHRPCSQRRGLAFASPDHAREIEPAAIGGFRYDWNLDEA